MRRNADSDVRLLQAAADPTRLAILRQLSSAGPTCACDFDDCCRDLSQPTVSHHLRVLREAGWIKGERRGTWIWYSLRADAVDRFGGILDGLRPGVARPAVARPATGLGPAPGRGRALDVLQPDWREW